MKTPHATTLAGVRMRATARARPDRWYRIENAAKDEATVWIYDEIVTDDGYWGGVPVDTFVRELAAITAKTVHLRINSPGGDVFGAMAIYTALRRHTARVVAHIDGVAASAASYIALAAEEVRMTKGAFLMIHNAHVIALGDKHALRESADLLDKVDVQIRDIYTGRTGASADDVQAWMDAETWYTADEALAAGFVDAIDHAEPVKAAFDLAIYNRVPEPLRATAQPGPENGRPEPRKLETIRDLEALLRDEAGLPIAAAKAIAAGGYKALADLRDEDSGGSQDDPGADPVAAVPATDLVAELQAALVRADVFNSINIRRVA